MVHQVVVKNVILAAMISGRVSGSLTPCPLLVLQEVNSAFHFEESRRQLACVSRAHTIVRSRDREEKGG
jgi:hypothetical protein